ncbi:hypothetical protein Bbelb_400630 [Branchiostoma belcheri]|nr:hypothetical protein Bbelb_400630 [Branchiostoma belcheri]
MAESAAYVSRTSPAPAFPLSNGHMRDALQLYPRSAGHMRHVRLDAIIACRITLLYLMYGDDSALANVPLIYGHVQGQPRLRLTGITVYLRLEKCWDLQWRREHMGYL